MNGSDTPRPFGPYENERQALAEPMPQAVRNIQDADTIRDTITGHLLRACDQAGIDLGAYDHRTLIWLADGETSTAQVLIGLISRAYAAGQEAARDWIVARDGGRYCERCEGEIQRGHAYQEQPGTGGLFEHIHCPDQQKGTNSRG